MLIMSIIISSLSTILTSTYNLYARSDITTTLFNVSQKIHIALNSEFSSCQDMYVYSADKYNKVKYDEYEAMIYLSGGRILKDTAAEKGAQLLLSDNSYLGSRVESISIKIGKVLERTSFDDPADPTMKMRLLYVTTVLKKGEVRYEHTSTIKLYNMQLWGTEIVKPDNILNAEYKCVVFHYSQYYSF